MPQNGTIATTPTTVMVKRHSLATRLTHWINALAWRCFS